MWALIELQRSASTATLPRHVTLLVITGELQPHTRPNCMAAPPTDLLARPPDGVSSRVGVKVEEKMWWRGMAVEVRKRRLWGGVGSGADARRTYWEPSEGISRFGRCSPKLMKGRSRERNGDEPSVMRVGAPLLGGGQQRHHDLVREGATGSCNHEVVARRWPMEGRPGGGLGMGGAMAASGGSARRWPGEGRRSGGLGRGGAPAAWGGAVEKSSSASMPHALLRVPHVAPPVCGGAPSSSSLARHGGGGHRQGAPWAGEEGDREPLGAKVRRPGCLDLAA